MSQIYRPLWKSKNKRLKQQAERKYQNVFRPGNSTFRGTPVLEQSIKHKRTLHTIFMDFKIVFDNVTNNTRWILVEEEVKRNQLFHYYLFDLVLRQL